MISEILKKEKLLQLVLDNIPSYVFWKDLNSTYLGCNLKFAQSAGLKTPEEIVGKTDYDLPWSKKDSKFYRKIDQEVMSSKKSQINFEEPQTIDNSTRWLRTSKIPLFDRNDVVIGILGSYEDITKRKQMELELVRRNEELKVLNAKLESINIDLEQFAYATSHDLQEPLRMIGGFVGLLERKYLTKLDVSAHEYITFIKEGTQRMSNMISQTLSYSKLENVESPQQEVYLSCLIQEIEKDLEVLIKENNAKLIVNLPAEKIACQAQRIKMLFFNLITNGIKFNRSSVPTIKIDNEDRGESLYFTVSDNGIGIEKEYQDEIFKPFKRLNTRDKFLGNGIGLSMCKRIATLHGGRIWCTNNKEAGTTFHFTIQKKAAYQ